MEVKVKDFDNLPQNLKVKFPTALEADLLCDLCKSVAAYLWVDPDKHCFCDDCVNMTTTDGIFECPIDESVFPYDKLRKDDTVPARLKNEIVICPNSSEDVPVKIPFFALKAHLSGCPCEMLKCPLCGGAYGKRSMPQHIISECSESATTCKSCGEDVLRKDLESHGDHCSRKPQTVSTASPEHSSLPPSPPSDKLPENVQQTPSPAPRQSPSTYKSLKEALSKCPYCGVFFPKRSILKHIAQKDCSKDAAQKDAPHNDLPEASVNGIQPYSPDRGAAVDAQRFDGNSSTTPRNTHIPPDMETRVVRIERAVEDTKKQQAALKQDLQQMCALHTQNLKNDKDEMLKNVTNLIAQFTEEQTRQARRSEDQMKQLQEKNDVLQTTVQGLSDDLEMVREEVNALRLLLDRMQSGSRS